MRNLKIAAIAFSALIGLSCSAYAFNEASVNLADIARAASQVERIDDAETRVQARNLISEAQSRHQDGDRSHAYSFLTQALGLAAKLQVAARPE